MFVRCFTSRVEVARPGASPALKRQTRLGPGLEKLRNLDTISNPIWLGLS